MVSFFVPSFSNHCSTSLDTDLIWTEIMNIFTTPCIQFDKRLLPGLSPAQAPCAEELQMPQDLVDNGNL